MVFDLGLILLIVVAIGIGWILGRFERGNSDRRLNAIKKRTKHIPKEYFQGLNFLLNEQPDQAVDLFAKTIDVNSDTVEIYLALGTNFRKRGEVDRAIKIHQDLLARPNLAEEPSADVQMALGQDYLAAGLLDRAERLLRELVEQSDEHRLEARKLLINIFEQEKDWPKAIEQAIALRQQGQKSIGAVIAQYRCESAQAAMEQGDWAAARSELKKALSDDKRCVRASILLGELEMKVGAFAEALKALYKIQHQDPRYIAISAPKVQASLEQLGRLDEYLDYLTNALKEHPDPKLLIILAGEVDRRFGFEEAVSTVQRFMEKHPSLLALHWLIEQGQFTSAVALEQCSKILQHLTADIVHKSYQYHCTDCGFTGNSLHWDCPSCKRWTSYKPYNPVLQPEPILPNR